MKCLIVLSAVLAVALAKPGFLGAGVVAPGIAAAVQPAAPVVVGGIHPGLAAYGPANIVIGAGGYPLDAPDVAAARAAHLAAVAQTRARDAAINGAALAAAHAAYAVPAVAAVAPAAYAAPAAGLLAAKAAYHG